MLEQMIAGAPAEWRELAALLLAPIVWVPRLQRFLIHFFLGSSSGWTGTAADVLLALPVLLVLIAVWCTQLSLYTLPFRSRRIDFLSMLLVAWWDAGRAILMYSVGMMRIAAVLAGWVLTLVRFAVRIVFEAIGQLVLLPASMMDRMTDRYFGRGVPWIALLMLVFWCALEATVFSYTLRPTMSQVLADLVGKDSEPRAARAFLWCFLFLLIMGSYVCIQALVEAVKKREFTFIVQIVLVELFVMFFEVVFLYRELVDAITPWIVQQTGDRFRPGPWFTLGVARFGWMGVRGMTWFLFGQYGTPPLLAVISRRRPTEGRPPTAAAPAWWQAPLEDFKDQVGWLHGKGDELLEYLGLPALHLVAAALNFVMVLVSARPLFSSPFKGPRAYGSVVIAG